MALIHAAPRARARADCCVVRIGSSGGVTFSTGGIHRAGAACARSSPMTTSGCRMPPAATCWPPATPACSTSRCISSKGASCNPEEEAYYDLPQRSAETASLYEHCVRAIKHGLRFGEHGLPLMGCGDWNDGMNLVGRHGKGESVWLAWFLYDNLQLFAGTRRRRGTTTAFAQPAREQAERLRANIEATCVGRRLVPAGVFRRWHAARLVHSTRNARSIRSARAGPCSRGPAMPSVPVRRWPRWIDRLVRRDARLIQLLDPPFDKSPLEPGYIKGYVPGVRENGGQYTHAAIWTVMAFAMMGDRERAWELVRDAQPDQPRQSARMRSRPTRSSRT